ncbi:alpha/beta hydrolase [Nocardioides kongjuensis]|uniref:Pimeloyl-ACP methyl ester carboxylesterase n=1 Tax=Nocardioides kongjuensis TaxID=349522 RepID=A0A852RI73_9ACTN|nr:alpha/beta fold hydrolase [Nocardioides kongjuensis]NYD33201.1 pimeloyl-ACP methyl ester carboxylesterase [Nocardioides kongjuensis]
MSDHFSIETSAGTLSGRSAGPRNRPRGLVVALHGGTYDSAYYDTGAGSLLETGAALGLCVVALDRPGYGSAAGIAPEHTSFAGQTAVLLEAVGKIAAEVGPEQGVVLVGHSIGGMIALQVAAEHPSGLRGVEVSGIGVTWRPGMLEMWSSFVGDAPSVLVPDAPHAEVMFGPAGTYDAAARALDAELIRPLPMPELADVVRWTAAFPEVAARIDVPVSVTFPEHDNIWTTDDDARASTRALFTGAAQVDVALLRTAGHCGELHHAARGYVLRQLAAVEDWLRAS